MLPPFRASPEQLVSHWMDSRVDKQKGVALMGDTFSLFYEIPFFSGKVSR
jgi:hypothetical protein